MDARAQQAREHHQRAALTDIEAELHRARRDVLVRALRNEDPVAWSYGKLAAAVGCSKTLVRQIVGDIHPPFKETDLVFEVFATRDQPPHRGPRGVRITHMPTGTMAEATDGRSQLENKSAALRALTNALEGDA